MLRFRLRNLLIVLALGPLVLAAGWTEYCRPRDEAISQEALKVKVLPGDYSGTAYESPP